MINGQIRHPVSAYVRFPGELGKDTMPQGHQTKPYELLCACERANDFVPAGPVKLRFGGIMSATVASSDMLNEIKEVNLSYLLLA
ncbi:MAG TPA: hypothetical protein VGL08_11620, partial [Paraburkholderia sp.]